MQTNSGSHSARSSGVISRPNPPVGGVSAAPTSPSAASTRCGSGAASCANRQIALVLRAATGSASGFSRNGRKLIARGLHTSWCPSMASIGWSTSSGSGPRAGERESHRWTASTRRCWYVVGPVGWNVASSPRTLMGGRDAGLGVACHHRPAATAGLRPPSGAPGRVRRRAVPGTRRSSMASVACLASAGLVVVVALRAVLAGYPAPSAPVARQRLGWKKATCASTSDISRRVFASPASNSARTASHSPSSRPAAVPCFCHSVGRR